MALYFIYLSIHNVIFIITLSMRIMVAQSCYSVIGDSPFLWNYEKFDPPWLCTSSTDFYQTWYDWLNFVRWGISPKWVKYNHSDFLCFSFFRVLALRQKSLRDLEDQRLKTHGIYRGCAICGSRPKMYTLSPNPQFSEFCTTKAVFRSKHK